MNEHNVPEAQPDPAPLPDLDDPEAPSRRDVPPESLPKSPGRPAVPQSPHPVPVPPGTTEERRRRDADS